MRTRRRFLSGVGAAACSPFLTSMAWGQAAAPALPLENLGVGWETKIYSDTYAKRT